MNKSKLISNIELVYNNFTLEKKLTEHQIEKITYKAILETVNMIKGWATELEPSENAVNDIQYNVINCPRDLVPVIAKIEHGNSLGHSSWYEVVYYSESNWQSYSGSKTFSDGEKVLKWKYCEDCL